ncbi:MAG: HAD-IA family hydrolase [Candidatus Magnetomorum sp.]|nr:HAD-IA family hydrolase [Candidatus Magnetomorum sp.]
MSSLKAIFFDLDNTLVDCRTADIRTYEILSILARKKQVNINTPQLIQCFQHLLIDVPFDPEGIIPVHPWRTGLWEKALHNQEIDDPILAEHLDTAFHSERLAYYTFIPGTQKMLDTLLPAYTGVIITNGDSEIQRPKLAACNAGKYFHHIVVGGEEPFEKPDPSIFYTACDLAKCCPDEAIMIGDSLKADIQGGLDSGLAATIWVNPENKEMPEQGPIPHKQVVSILELPSIINTLEKDN